MWRAETNADRAKAVAEEQKKWQLKNFPAKKESHSFRIPRTRQQVEDERAYEEAVRESDRAAKREEATAQAEWDAHLSALPQADNVAVVDIYRHGRRLLQQKNGLAAAQVLWISLIVGNRRAALDLYEITAAGEHGVAKHKVLAACFLSLAGSLCNISERARRDGVSEKCLDPRVFGVRAPKAIHADAREMAGQYGRGLYEIVSVLTDAVLLGERCFRLHGCTEWLAARHLERVDETVASAVRRAGYGLESGFPLEGLGGYHMNEWSILEFFNVPEVPPPWQLGKECFLCERGFTLLRRRHHCRNCGVSCCHDHSNSFFNRLHGWRPIPKGQSNRDGKARVCDVCHDLIMNFDADGVRSEKVRPGLPFLMADLLGYDEEGVGNSDCDSEDADETTNHLSEAGLRALSIRELRSILTSRSISHADCLEKSDLVQRVLESH